MRRLGEQAGGWKVGYSPEGGIFCAPIYASKVHASPASLPASGFHVIGIECEIGFRVNQAFGPRARPYRRDEVLAGVLAAPDDRGRRFALPGFPLARPAAGARRQFLERRAGLRRRRHRAGRGWTWCIRRSTSPPTAEHFAECTGLRAGDPIDAAGRAGQFCREQARRRARPAPSSRPARIPGWCSPSPVPIFAPITARSAIVEVSFPR